MAAGDLVYRRGTPLVLKASGGDYALTLASLANGAARQSAKINFGTVAAEWWELFCEIIAGSAPTAGKPFHFYLSRSLSATAATQNAGGASGADEAYKAGEVAEWAEQLEPIGTLPATNDSTTVTQMKSFLFQPVTQYGSIVVYNLWGVALANSSAIKLTLTPLIPQYQTS